MAAWSQQATESSVVDSRAIGLLRNVAPFFLLTQIHVCSPAVLWASRCSRASERSRSLNPERGHAKRPPSRSITTKYSESYAPSFLVVPSMLCSASRSDRISKGPRLPSAASQTHYNKKWYEELPIPQNILATAGAPQLLQAPRADTRAVPVVSCTGIEDSL